MTLDNSETVKWDCTFMDAVRFNDKLKAVPSFKRCFDSRYCLNAHLLREIKYKTGGGDDHIVFELVGQQGSGKSRVAQQLAPLIAPITINNICFRNEEVLEKCEILPKGSVLIEDEQTVGVGEGAEREKLEKQNLIEVTRKHGLSLFFLSPTSRHLSSVHYILEVVQRCTPKRLSRVAVRKGDGYIGYITVYIPPDDKDELYKEYIPLKDQFIETFLKRNLGRLDYGARAEILLEHSDIKFCKTLRDLETLSMELNPTLTVSENQRIARKVQFLRLKKSRQKIGAHFDAKINS